jgi:hypothetical protein
MTLDRVMFWHKGAYAPIILKYILDTFWNIKKNEKKIAQTSSHATQVQSRFMKNRLVVWRV